MKRDAYFLYGTFVFGIFGFVAAAVVAATGDSVAVKEYQARHPSDLKQMDYEAGLSLLFKV